MYVPTFALQVLEHNERAQAEADKINLQGILVGNGVTGDGSIPSDVAQANDVEFFFGHALYNSSLHTAIVAACGDFKTPTNACQGLIGEMHQQIGHINVYNIYGPCIMAMDKNGNKVEQNLALRAPLQDGREWVGEGGPDGCIDASAAKLYLDSPVVRKAIHVDVPQKNGKDWAICGGIQYRSDFGSLLPHYKNELIGKIRVLIFNGDVDCCVPYKGNEWWTSSLEVPLVKGWRQWT
jgi:carboxypeptidase C (cathepsin A)